MLGEDLRDLGAAVAVRVVERLGGAVSVEGDSTLTIRLPWNRRSQLVAGAAARLVRVERTDDDRLAVGRCREAVDESLRHRRRPAAAMADGLQLVDELGPAEQLGHRAERQAAEVLVEAGGDDARAALDQALDHVDDLWREELDLVDPDDVVAVSEPDDLLGRETATARIFAPA